MPQVKHLALLRFKPGTPPATIDQIYRSLANLCQTVPGLLDFCGGPYSSPEGLNQGFTHGFVMTFADEKSRDAYLPHPDHVAVAELAIPHLEGGLAGVAAFDFLVPDPANHSK